MCVPQVKLRMEPPFSSTQLVAGALSMSLLSAWMQVREAFTANASPSVCLCVVDHCCPRRMQADDFEIDTFSYIQAEQGSAPQRWHTDVRSLHPSDPRHEREAPPYGIVQITPLVGMGDGTGATEFRCGSHAAERRGAAEGEQDAAAGEREAPSAADEVTAPDDDTCQVRLAVTRGDAIFMDLRLRHRGGGHEGSSPRAVLYMSYVREWFRDAVNFRGTQSRGWDALQSARVRKLLGRVDTRDYIKRLEERLVESGMDPAELASLHARSTA